MSLTTICQRRGCGRVAIEGEAYCDPCLEILEDGGPAAIAKRERMDGYTRKAPSGSTMTPLEKLASVTQRFSEAQERGDRVRMFDACYQARKLTRAHGVELPEWASPFAEWRIRELLSEAAFEAGAAALALPALIQMFRARYAAGALAASGGNQAEAARKTQVHRTTLGRYRGAA